MPPGFNPGRVRVMPPPGGDRRLRAGLRQVQTGSPLRVVLPKLRTGSDGPLCWPSSGAIWLTLALQEGEAVPPLMMRNQTCIMQISAKGPKKARANTAVTTAAISSGV